jgi:hypothetical protein
VGGGFAEEGEREGEEEGDGGEPAGHRIRVEEGILWCAEVARALLRSAFSVDGAGRVGSLKAGAERRIHGDVALGAEAVCVNCTRCPVPGAHDAHLRSVTELARTTALIGISISSRDSRALALEPRVIACKTRFVALVFTTYTINTGVTFAVVIHSTTGTIALLRTTPPAILPLLVAVLHHVGATEACIRRLVTN